MESWRSNLIPAFAWSLHQAHWHVHSTDSSHTAKTLWTVWGLEQLVHKRLRHLDTNEHGGIGREGSRHGRAKALEERANTVSGDGVPSAVQEAAVRALRSTLVARLDRVGGDGNSPHGHAGKTTCGDGVGNVQVVHASALGGKRPLGDFVGSEVGRASGTITRERGTRALEDGADTTLLVQLAHHVARATVLGGTSRLALQLQQHLDALSRSSHQRGWHGTKETGKPELTEREVLVRALRRRGVHNLLAQVVGQEGECKDGGHTNQRRAHTAVETLDTIRRDGLADHIHRARVGTRRGGLQTGLDQVEGVADKDGADATKATRNERLDRAYRALLLLQVGNRFRRKIVSHGRARKSQYLILTGPVLGDTTRDPPHVGASAVRVGLAATCGNPEAVVVVMADAFQTLPEFFETDLGESLQSRTETLAYFRELGPPDLVHVYKSNGRRNVGSYHFVSGVDASSSATLATYITSLDYEMESPSAWFRNKPLFRLKGGVYCCFNAFSRVDLRVEVCIPGSVEAYTINVRGERGEVTPEMWQETYLSAALRAILYSDDANYRLSGYRRLDPIPSPEHEVRFLLAAENLFFKGWQLGSEPEIQVATVVHNHLSAGILKYFGEASRYEQAVNLFEKLWAREPEVAALVAQAYLGMNEEVKAVQVMHRALQENPQSYVLLHIQADFVRKKGQLSWAIELAKQAVNSAPSEFVTWAKLADLFADAGDWESALFTLNSCPMFTYNERDLHRLPPAARSHLPVRPLVADSKLLNEFNAMDQEADVALLRLPAPALRGTFAKAYAILVKLVDKIGWDELLRYRSQVFVMEEEYRSRNQIREQGLGGAQGDGELDAAGEPEKSEKMAEPERASFAENGEEPKSGDPGPRFSFTDKRLCERWLDNLFMVLYEDLRVYTIWRAEMAHYQAQSLPYRKSGTDWEILGELALRLHHPQEAHDAFVQCINLKFSVKAYQRLLERYTELNLVEQALSAAVRLTAYYYRWYSESVFPGPVAKHLFRLIKSEGLAKVSYTLMSMTPPAAMLQLSTLYLLRATWY